MHPWLLTFLFAVPLLAIRVLITYWLNRRRHQRLEALRARTQVTESSKYLQGRGPGGLLTTNRRQVACDSSTPLNKAPYVTKFGEDEVHSQTYRVILEESDEEDLDSNKKRDNGDDVDVDDSSSQGSSSEQTEEVEGEVTPRPPDVPSAETESPSTLADHPPDATEEVAPVSPPPVAAAACPVAESGEPPAAAEDGEPPAAAEDGEPPAAAEGGEPPAAEGGEPPVAEGGEPSGEATEAANEAAAAAEVDEEGPRDATEYVEEFERSDEAATAAKEEGNLRYRAGEFEEAIEEYNKALNLTPSTNSKLAATILGNLAAVYYTQEKYTECVQACDDTIELDKDHVKARVRRYKANRALKKYHDALNDLQTALDLDPTLRSQYGRELTTIEKLSKEQFEKEKEEMIGKAKEFGNWALGKLGMSLDHFKVVQDPTSGSYNIQYAPPTQPTATSDD